MRNPAGGSPPPTHTCGACGHRTFATPAREDGRSSPRPADPFAACSPEITTPSLDALEAFTVSSPPATRAPEPRCGRRSSEGRGWAASSGSSARSPSAMAAKVMWSCAGTCP